MTVFDQPISCGNCGGNLSLNQSVARAGTECISLLRCRGCNAEWSLTSYLRPVRSWGAIQRTRFARKETSAA